MESATKVHSAFSLRVFGRETFAVHINDATVFLVGLRGQENRDRKQQERKEFCDTIQPMAMPRAHFLIPDNIISLTPGGTLLHRTRDNEIDGAKVTIF